MSAPDFYQPALRRLRRVVRADAGVSKLSQAETLRLEELARLAARLEQLRAELDKAPIVVRGSRAQPRANPLIAIEAQLVAQIDRQLAQLVRDVENRRMGDEVRELTAFSD